MDRVGSPPGRIVRGAVTGRWLRGPAGPYGRAARRRSSWRWRAISCSRCGCIDVGLSTGDPWGPVSPPSRRAGGKVTAWLFFRRRDVRHGQAPWPGPHRGPAGRAAGRHARGRSRRTLCRWIRIRCTVPHLPGQPPIPGGLWRSARPSWPGSFGNGTDCRLREASPEGVGRVEYRGAAKPSPEGATGRLGTLSGIRPSCRARAAASVRLAARPGPAAARCLPGRRRA